MGLCVGIGVIAVGVVQVGWFVAWLVALLWFCL